MQFPGSSTGRQNCKKRCERREELSLVRSLERIVSAYLDLAENRAERHIPMTMEKMQNEWKVLFD